MKPSDESSTKAVIVRLLKENPAALASLKQWGICEIQSYVLQLDKQTGQIELINKKEQKHSPLIEGFRQGIDQVLKQNGPEQIAKMLSHMLMKKEE